MAIKQNREYRNFNPEIRMDEEKQECRVCGYASTFEAYELFRDGDMVFNERIDPDAFRDADMSDVIFLYNHEGMVFARQKNGTLNVSVDERGLWTDADLSSTEQSRQMFESIRTGLVDQMSFAFTVADDEMQKDGNVYTRIIHKISKVYDVSAVSIPANPDTDISAVSARSYFNGVIEAEKAERLEREKRDALKNKIKILLEV